VPAQINALTTDEAQVALIIAAHNAAIEYTKESANGDASGTYASTFRRIYTQLAASVEAYDAEDEDEDVDDEEDEDDEDDEDVGEEDDDDDL